MSLSFVARIFERKKGKKVFYSSFGREEHSVQFFPPQAIKAPTNSS